MQGDDFRNESNGVSQEPNGNNACNALNNSTYEAIIR